MLESASERLCEKGMPHYGSPDKIPAVRLQTLAEAGKAQVPLLRYFDWIGETRLERIESCSHSARASTIRAHSRNHRANFRAKPTPKWSMRQSPIWRVLGPSLARILFGAQMSVQAHLT